MEINLKKFDEFMGVKHDILYKVYYIMLKLKLIIWFIRYIFSNDLELILMIWKYKNRE